MTDVKTYLFDTSAVLTYLQDEQGADSIQTLLLQYLTGQIHIVISVITLIELRYKLMRQYSPQVVDEMIQKWLWLNIQAIDFTMPLVEWAASYKATAKMSFADACIAATAKHRGAVLVHKDPEYQSILDDIEQLPLPFKPKTS